MKDNQMKTPVLILSGEGTQTETIKALRLGAKDYVLKDKVDVELLDQVKKILSEWKYYLEEQALKYLPTPIALFYNRFINSTNPVERLRKLINFYEACLRFCVIIGISEALTIGLSHSTKKTFGHLLSKPTMGKWNRLRYLLTKEMNNNSMFFQINQSTDNKLIDSIIDLRNDIFHGIDPSAALAQKILDDFNTSLDTFIGSLCENIKYYVFFSVNLDFDGETFKADGYKLIGDNIALPKHSLSSRQPMVKNKPFVIMDEKDNLHTLNLHPWILIDEACEVPSSWNILIYDGLKKSAAFNFEEEQVICYLNVWSGNRYYQKVKV